MSAIISPLCNFLCLKFNFSSHFFKIFIIPVLEGLIFTFLIIKFRFLSKKSQNNKKSAAEDISPGIS